MINGLVVLAAVLLGYGTIVGCCLAMTFAITSAAPGFVAANHKITNSYKWLEAMVWLICTTLGGFVAAVTGQGTYPWIIVLSLIVATVVILWMNTWEARQRGLAHQILMSLISITGTTAGFVLATHLLRLG